MKPERIHTKELLEIINQVREDRGVVPTFHYSLLKKVRRILGPRASKFATRSSTNLHGKKVTGYSLPMDAAIDFVMGEGQEIELRLAVLDEVRNYFDNKPIRNTVDRMLDVYAVAREAKVDPAIKNEMVTRLIQAAYTNNPAA